MAAYQTVLGEKGIEVTEQDYLSSLGMNDVRFVQAAYGRAGLPLPDELLTEILEQKTGAHRALIEDELPIFPGVITFVKAASRQFRIGLVSMARRGEIDYVMERANLSDYFETVVSAEDVQTCKPDPACYNKGFELLTERIQKSKGELISAGECLVIEDSPPGIRAGKTAGMRTLAITNTVAESELRKAGADVVSNSLSDWNVDAVRRVFVS